MLLLLAMANASLEPCAALASDFTQRRTVCSKWPHRRQCQRGLRPPPLANIPRTWCCSDGNRRLRRRPWWGTVSDSGHCRAAKRCLLHT